MVVGYPPPGLSVLVQPDRFGIESLRGSAFSNDATSVLASFLRLAGRREDVRNPYLLILTAATW